MIKETVQSQSQDVEALVKVSDTPPLEAAENILGGEENDIPADSYKQLKPMLLAKNEVERYPTSAPKPVADVMAESTQHAAIVKQDLVRLSDFEKQVRLSIDTIKGTDYGREINDLQYKRSKGISLSPDETFQLVKYKNRLSELTTAEDYGYEFGASLPSQVAGALYGMGKGVVENFGIVASMSGLGASGGALLGSLAGVPGAVALGTAGGVKGAVLGTGVAILVDTYKQSVGGVYGELSNLTEAEIPLSESEKRAISKGAGLLMAGVGLLPMGVIAKKVPWLNKIISPKAVVNTIRGPMRATWLKLTKDLAMSGLAEAIEEGTQEAIQIVAEEMGKSWNGKETSFIDGWSRAVTKWETVKRIGKAAAVGSVAGPIVQGGLRVVGATLPTRPDPKVINVTASKSETIPIVTDIVNSNSNLPTNIKGTRAVQLKIAMDQASKITKETETNKLIPKKMDQIRQEIFDDAGLSYVYLDKETLNEWANSEERAAKVKALLSEMNLLESDLNAPIRIDSHKFLRLVDDFADISDHVKSSPEGMTAAQYVKQLEEADAKRAKALEDAPNPETGVTAEINQAEEQQITPRDQDIHDEPSYLEQPTFTEAMYDVIPKAEIMKINEAQLTTRVEVADAIKADAAKEMNAVINLELEAGLEIEREQAIIDSEDDKKIQLVEKFVNGRVIGELNEKQKELQKAKRPIHSIDPDSLTPELKNRFLEDQALKARKVFTKGGVNINDAVITFGAESAADLLTTLSSSPTLKQATDNAIERVRAAQESEAIANSDFEKSRIAEAYDNMTKIHLKEMKILRESNWAAVKAGVKRIANPLPRIADLNIRAKSLVGSTQVRNLNVNQWKVGERRSQKLAVKAILDNHVEEAFRQKENAALNTQLAKETHVAIGKVNNALRYISRLSSPRVQASLKEAGKTYQRAIGDLLSLYNFNPRSSQQDIDNYNKYTKRMLEQGRGDFRIPDDVMKWLTTRKSAKDLTVDQLLFLADKIKSVMHQAAYKNVLVEKYLKLEDAMTTEEFEDYFHELAMENPKYDEGRLVVTPGKPSLGEKVVNFLSSSEAAMQNIQFIIKELDLEKLNGPHAKMLYQPLDGSGLYSHSSDGRRSKVRRQARLLGRFKKSVNKFGRSEFLKMGLKYLSIPEFQGTALGAKKLAELDLFMIAMHIGNAGNLRALENFGVERDTFFKVLERELSEKHLDFIQEMVWGTYENYRPDIAKLEKETTGIDIEFTIHQPFKMFGKEYRGGHMPIKYARDSSLDNIIEQNKSLGKNSKDFLPKSSAFEGIVYSPHTKERVGSDWHLDLDPDTLSRGFEEVIHDLTMRRPVSAVMSLLNNESIAKSLIGQVGREKYNALVNLVSKQAHAAPSLVLFKATNKLMNKSIATVNSGMAINFIAANLTSLFKNFLAVPQIGARIGVKNTARYLSAAALKFPFHFNEMRELAAEIDPTMYTYKEGIDDFSSRTIWRHLPKKRLLAIPGYNWVKTMQERAIDMSMSTVLGGLDNFFKTIAISAGYTMFMNGKAPGHSLESVMAMTEEERELNARAFAAQLSQSTTMAAQELDKAGIQFSAYGPLIAMFWNEARNQLNNRLGDFRDVKANAERAAKKVKAGDYFGAQEELQNNTDTAMRLLLMAVASQAIVKAATGFGDDEDEDASFFDMFVEYLSTFEGVANTAMELGPNSTLLVRDIVFAIQTGQTPSFPALQFLADLSKIATATGTAIYDNFEYEISLIESIEDLSDKEIKAFLNVAGVAVGGLPVSGYMKGMKYLEEVLDLEDGEINGKVVQGAILNLLNGFIERNDEAPKTEDELFEAIRKRANGEETSTLQQAVDQAKGIVAQLTPESNDEPLDDEEYEILKFTESGGKWRAKAPGSSAFGYYQFTKGTWKLVMNTPEGRAAGLTVQGMFKRDGVQQEIAMRIFTKMNAKVLKQLGVPVNIETLYFSHHFRPQLAPRVYGVPDTTKIKDIVTPDVIRANPRLKKMKVDTAGEMKEYISGLLERGKTLYNGHQLTTGL